MKKIYFTFSIILVFVSSFGQTKLGKPEVNPLEVQKTYQIWKAYQLNNIVLSRDFIALDADSKEITTDNFLQQLSEGNYIPIRLESGAAVFYYQLFAIAPTSDTSIKATIAEKAFDEIDNLTKEGKSFPEFSFKDLNGNLLTNESLKGKVVAIKCWYIHCAACLKEFPDVNKLVENYKDRKDVVFVSLAEDTPEQLKPFLIKRPLAYAVVPNMKTYMNLTLKLNAFPTHFIIDKEGTIAKVVSDSKGLEVALEKVSAEK